MKTVFRNAVTTSQKTHCASITMSSWLILLAGFITVYSENYVKHVGPKYTL
jgi:hypothetical protein